ncbi:hypothetical protein [Psychrobacter sp. I-STPA10]|uniref:hypothetical protein n=1 Tax=Psychrobacter sp. I-STPA10 TaxID=2585769 RepID=UPI001E34510C|nr:hypothetical protein [Psychrobacter sp. I-STPA10]
MFINDKKIGVTCVMGILLLSLGLGGCQKHDEPANSISDESIEEVQPMSAEPAETEQALVIDSEQTPEEASVADGLASENIVEVSYNCTPALAVHATYNKLENNVVLDIANNGVVLTTSNPDGNPLVYTDEQDITQWRVTQGAQDDMGQAVLRTNEDDKVQSYECGIVS